jgi:hypothetical protein
VAAPAAAAAPPKPKGACYNCGSADHFRRECPAPQKAGAVGANQAVNAVEAPPQWCFGPPQMNMSYPYPGQMAYYLPPGMQFAPADNTATITEIGTQEGNVKAAPEVAVTAPPAEPQNDQANNLN